MSQTTMEKAELEKTIAEMRKLNEETRKFVDDAHKARAEGDLALKRAKWYEFSMLLAAIGATVALTKIFL